MKWHTFLTALKIARKVEQQAGALGLTIKGRNPAEVDAAVEGAVTSVIGALKKKPAGRTS